MPALPADIGAAIRDAIVVQWSDDGIHGRYPSSRDALSSPSTGYFDTLADAQVVIAARGNLIGAERRRFSAVVQDIVWLDPVMVIPTVEIIDGELVATGGFVTCRIEIDLEAETTTIEVFG